MLLNMVPNPVDVVVLVEFTVGPSDVAVPNVFFPHRCWISGEIIRD